jgi:hypothetical protein
MSNKEKIIAVVEQISCVSAFKPDLFDGKNIIVSGASSGIGLVIARGY